MPTDYLPAKDGDFRTWLNNFYTVCANNASTLGLTAAELTTIDAAASNFSAALDANLAAQSAARGARADKVDARADTTRTVRGFVREFQANPAVTDVLKGQLGITIPDTTRTKTPPNVPLDLTAAGWSNGVNTLKWNRNGNPQGTQFVIEARYGSSANWEFVDVTTKAKYDHEGQAPGRMVGYRVWAKRHEAKSGYSNEAVVYLDNGMDALYLPQAA